MKSQHICPLGNWWKAWEGEGFIRAESLQPSLNQSPITEFLLLFKVVGLPCGPVVKDLPANAGDIGLIPGHAAGPPSLCAPTTEVPAHTACAWQQEKHCTEEPMHRN